MSTLRDLEERVVLSAAGATNAKAKASTALEQQQDQQDAMANAKGSAAKRSSPTAEEVLSALEQDAVAKGSAKLSSTSTTAVRHKLPDKMPDEETVSTRLAALEQDTVAKLPVRVVNDNSPIGGVKMAEKAPFTGNGNGNNGANDVSPTKDANVSNDEDEEIATALLETGDGIKKSPSAPAGTGDDADAGVTDPLMMKVVEEAAAAASGPSTLEMTAQRLLHAAVTTTKENYKRVERFAPDIEKDMFNFLAPTEALEEQVRLREDIYSLIYTAHPISQEFIYAIFVCGLQSTLLWLILVDLVDFSNPDNRMKVPAGVPVTVNVAQGLGTILIVYIVAVFGDLTSGLIRLFDGHENTRPDDCPHATRIKWFLSGILQLQVGLTMAMDLFILMLQATNVIGMCLNFAGKVPLSAFSLYFCTGWRMKEFFFTLLPFLFVFM